MPMLQRVAGLAAVAVLAGGAVALTAGTAAAGDEYWPKGSGIAPAGDEPWPKGSGIAPAADEDGIADSTGWLPDYPLNENVGALGEDPWPRGSG
ncbi:hypothetical protein P8605_23510 [Streptomyces sp. T-3]|nr:hypothetical protein [Streptomyces sp. T-3]